MKPLRFALAALALSQLLNGCITLRQPREFKNRKMKQDPPILGSLPSPQAAASAGNRERI